MCSFFADDFSSSLFWKLIQINFLLKKLRVLKILLFNFQGSFRCQTQRDYYFITLILALSTLFSKKFKIFLIFSPFYLLSSFYEIFSEFCQKFTKSQCQLVLYFHLEKNFSLMSKGSRATASKTITFPTFGQEFFRRRSSLLDIKKLGQTKTVWANTKGELNSKKILSAIFHLQKF